MKGTSSAPLRFGIMSTAQIATKVCKAMHLSKGAKPVAVASRSASKARAWAKKHKVEKSHGDYQALLDDDEVDAVYIALPPSMHLEWTIKAAQAGKHVLCEKPLAASLAEANEMAAACEKNGVVLMDGVMWVHHARAAKLRALLDKGSLGKLKRVTSAFTFCWETWPKDNIRLNKQLGGGSLGDLGWYCIRLTWAVFGELPKQVLATARYYQGVDVNLSALMWFDGDRMASFDCGFDTVMRQWFEIAGTKASAVCDDFVLPVSNETARIFVHDGTGKKRKEIVAKNSVQEVAMIEDFAKEVKSGHAPFDWLGDALVTQRLCDALALSAREGAAVEIAS